MKDEEKLQKGKKGSGHYRRNQREQKSDQGHSDGTKSTHIIRAMAPNDPLWYAPSQQLVKDAASLAFASYPGTNTKFAADAWAGLSTFTIYPFIPCFGVSADGSSAINRSAAANYSFVRHANSGARNYEAPDLMIYNLAYGQCIMGITALIRLYGILRVYYFKNKLIPYPLLQAMGVSIPNFTVGDLARFRSQINQMIFKLSGLGIPKGMTCIDRWNFLCANVFKDGDSEKSSLFVYLPNFIFRFDANTTTRGGALFPYQFMAPNLDRSLDELVQVVDQCINAIITDEDSGMMSGDQLKAYGRENLYSFVELDEGYNCIPVYHPEVMEQMHNMRIAPSISAVWLNDAATAASFTNNIFRLEQCNNTLISIPVITADRNSNGNVKDLWSFKDGLYDSLKDSPEADDVMVGTRFCFTLPLSQGVVTIAGIGTPCYSVTATELNLIPTSSGSEIISEPYVLHTKVDSSDLYAKWADDAGSCMSIFKQSESNNTSLLTSIGGLSKLDWHPLLYWVPSTTTDVVSFTTGSNTAYLTNKLEAVIGDLYNYTEITEPILRIINETALLREFTIPVTTIA